MGLDMNAAATDLVDFEVEAAQVKLIPRFR